jgi:regulator of sirC expression with transglutaminase-like and TPR domain
MKLPVSSFRFQDLPGRLFETWGLQPETFMMDSKEYFEKLMKKPEEEIRLAEAALYIASDEYPEIDIPAYLTQLNEWSHALKKEISRKPKRSRLDLLNGLLFDKMHFSGNIDNYYDPKNSFLNEVIDSRKGIPISLSVIYLELAWNLGLEATGIGFPGHFLVRINDRGEMVYVDAFYRGRIMTVNDCVEFWNDISEGELEFQDSFLSSMNKHEILIRMLRNLKGIYLEQKNYRKLISVMDKLVILNPHLPEEIRDRGIIYYQMQAYRLALTDFEGYLSAAPESEDAEVIHQYIEVLREFSNHVN